MSRAVSIESDANDHADVALGFRHLEDRDVAAQTDANSFSRGETYFRGRRIFNGVRRGATLRARCRGSSGGPYHVEATLAALEQTGKKRNPLSFSCCCPRGGFCKHVVALLLTWIDNPLAFEERPPIAEMLAGRTPEELVGVIEVFLKADPDLERLIELPTPMSAPVTDSPLDGQVIRQQIAAALRQASEYDAFETDEEYGHYNGYDRYDGYWDYEEETAGSRAAAALEPLVARAEAHAAVGQLRNALLLTAVLAEELAPALDSIDDESGALDEIVIRADTTLAACLDAQAALPEDQRCSVEERSQLIAALMTIWEHDLEGRLDISQAGPEAIGRSASPEEQQAVSVRVREVLKGAKGNPAQLAWLKRSAIGFLSLLVGSAGLSDEELLSEYRSAELWDETAALLVRLGRVDEAIHLASRHLPSAAGLLPFADQVLASEDPRHVSLALSLVDDRLWEREGQHLADDQALRQWLESRYLVHGQPEKALSLVLDRFKAAPNQNAYAAVKAIACDDRLPAERWAEIQPSLRKILEKQGSWTDLIAVHLEEGAVGLAIAALKESEKPRRPKQPYLGYSWTPSAYGYDLKVAAAAEAEYPDEAVRIYRQKAEAEIGARQRTRYQQAAAYLVRVMNTLEAHGRGDEWNALIADVRDQNRSLRALREELDALGLR